MLEQVAISESKLENNKDEKRDSGKALHLQDNREAVENGGRLRPRHLHRH